MFFSRNYKAFIFILHTFVDNQNHPTENKTKGKEIYLGYMVKSFSNCVCSSCLLTNCKHVS